MNSSRWTRSDFIIMGVLFALLIAWGPLVQWWVGGTSPTQPPEAPPATKENIAEAVETPVLQATPSEPMGALPLRPPPVLPPERTDPENLFRLSNGVIRLIVSRIGAGIVQVEMLKYPESPESPRSLTLDFAEQPALSLAVPAGREAALGFPFGDDQPFEAEPSPEGRSIRFRGLSSDGQTGLERTVTLGDDYQITVRDRFFNPGAKALNLPDYGVCVGPLFGASASADRRQGFYLGIDSLSSSGGADVHHWGGGGFFSRAPQLSQFFQPPERRGGGCDSFKPALKQPLPRSIRHFVRDRTDWLAVKNKFFAQILIPTQGAAGFVLEAERWVPPTEDPERPASWMTAPLIHRVGAEMILDGVSLPPGGEEIREMAYYVGPKEYRRLAAMGNRIVEIMEFGRLRPLCWLLLVTLNGLYAIIPNYGVAIILLTLLLRLIFWPITHKSTESMRKMQEIQPLLAQVRERYKGKPQMIQEETMRIYREHKVNPMGGCLPMLIQIPVFIALFNVLRSAVELRYASFLWIRDLSEPENLFAGQLPFVSGLNILPLLMTATSIWQSHLTPSGGDPSQQRMMMWMMPLMMLFIFYNMPSALVLYWTANQVVMIVQLLWQKRWNEARARG